MWRARVAVARGCAAREKLTGCVTCARGRGYDPEAENAFADLPMVVRASSLSGSGFRVDETGPLRAVHLSRHKWLEGLDTFKGICCPLSERFRGAAGFPVVARAPVYRLQQILMG